MLWHWLCECPCLATEFHSLPGRRRISALPGQAGNTSLPQPDPCRRVSEQGMDQPGKETSSQTTLLHKQQCSAICSFTTYFDNSCYMLTELTGEREAPILRIPATRASFQHRENGFPSCQLSETWNMFSKPAAATVAMNSWAFRRRKEQQVKLLSTGIIPVNLPLHPCCWKTSPDQGQRPKQEEMISQSPIKTQLTLPVPKITFSLNIINISGEKKTKN